MKDEIYIRHYKREDRPKIREICYETAFMGESAEAFFDDKEILADAVTSYYTDYEPGSIFIAEYQENIIGYLTGCIDSSRYRRILINRILPKIIIRSVFCGKAFKPKIARFLYHSMISFFRGEFKKPRLKQYPAHLHISVTKNYRRMGVGSKLINSFSNYLKNKNIKGVHIVTISKKARLFFEKAGFKLFHSRKMKQLYYLLGKDTAIYILTREI